MRHAQKIFKRFFDFRQGAVDTLSKKCNTHKRFHLAASLPALSISTSCQAEPTLPKKRFCSSVTIMLQDKNHGNVTAVMRAHYSVLSVQCSLLNGRDARLLFKRLLSTCLKMYANTWYVVSSFVKTKHSTLSLITKNL